MAQDRCLPEMRPDSLMQRTLDLIEEALLWRGDQAIGTRVRDIAQSCGIHHEWLLKLRNGTIRDPGVIRLEALYWHLRELEKSERWAAKRRKAQKIAAAAAKDQ
jgi:hypothetical protein